MRKFFGRFLLICGGLLLIAALGLAGYNVWDSYRAGKASDEILSALDAEMPDTGDVSDGDESGDSETSGNSGTSGDSGISGGSGNSGSSGTSNGSGSSGTNGASDSSVPLYEQFPDMEMPTIDVNGYRYIGTLTIPAKNLRLPVMDTWDESRLKISPCRYSGSVYTKDIVIAGHAYFRHFTPIKSLKIGDSVIFTDCDGNVFHYHVAWTESMDPSEEERMLSEDENDPWDLTLFTCILSNDQRFALRCVLD